MSLPCAWALQTGLRDHLSTDAGLQMLVGTPARIFDALPTDTVFPVLTIGAGRVRDYAGVDGAREHDVRLHAYSRWGGRGEVKRVLDTIYDRLHDSSFPLEGHRVAACRFVFADIFKQIDQDTFQGVARYRVVTEPSLAVQ
jgi:hypothetical protein